MNRNTLCAGETKYYMKALFPRFLSLFYLFIYFFGLANSVVVYSLAGDDLVIFSYNHFFIKALFPLALIFIRTSQVAQRDHQVLCCVKLCSTYLCFALQAFLL